MSELIVLTLEPLADPIGGSLDAASIDRRLRFLLKRMKRWDGFRCVSVASGPQAWAGWARREGEWQQLVSGVSPQVVLAMLIQEAASDTMLVLPGGLTPP